MVVRVGISNVGVMFGVRRELVVIWRDVQTSRNTISFCKRIHGHSHSLTSNTGSEDEDSDTGDERTEEIG